MEIKIYTVKLDLPHWLRNTIVYGVIPVVTLVGGALAVRADVTLAPPFVAGTQIKAADVNANFSALKTAVEQLQADLGVMEASEFAPAGIILPYGGDGSSPPAGWLLCDGLAVSRSQFAALFGVIGVRYGAGDGTTTFNVPNLTGDRFLMGVPTARVGEVGGSNVIVADGAHDHTFGQTLADTVPDSSHFTDGAILNPAGSHNHGGDKRPLYLGTTFIIRAR